MSLVSLRRRSAASPTKLNINPKAAADLQVVQLGFLAVLKENPILFPHF